MSYENKLFDKCIEFILKNEGGYVNDPDDLGKETYRGISRKFWPLWKGWPLIDAYKKNPGFPDSIDKDQCLLAEVKDFYHENFWQPINLGLIVNENTVLQIFDFGINARIKTAVKLAQEIAGTKKDGILGHKTAFQINSFGHRFTDLYIKGRILYYENITVKRPKNAKFLKGWIRRAEHTKFNYS